MKYRVNAYDVAKLANVSQSTVSRVLNNYPYIKEETRNKVLDAINELAFSPDEIARSLAVNKTDTIGLIVEDISNPFYSETAHVILREARKYNYEVIMIDTDDDQASLEKAVSTLVGKRVDGIIVASVKKDTNNLDSLTENNIPMVLYNRKVDNEENVNYIEVDNKLGAIEVVDYLAELNHEKIAYISGPTIYSTFHERLQGYCEGLLNNNLEYDEAFVYQGKISYDYVFEFASELMKKENSPSAFFASADQIALAVMNAAAHCGKRIPEDVSVVGFDDIDIASNPFINLTTVSQQKEKMASLALQGLIKLIESKNKKSEFKQIVLSPKLIIRKTVGENKELIIGKR